MKTIRVVAAVIRDGEKIFATMRGYGDFKGLWEFPGGKIESAEARWLTKETLKSVDWLPADSGLIEKIEKALALLPS